ncbi:MAG: tRNA adenosine(34) deaminase TadA [Elainellaceae cyanobacterium]
MSYPIPPPAFDHPEYQRHHHWMSRAIALADAAGQRGDVPVGAIVVDPNNKLIAEGQNNREGGQDPTAHAEIVALRAAGQVRRSWRLTDCTLYVTLEPCPMCAGAVILSRISTVVYGADDVKTGAARTAINLFDGPWSNHSPRVIGGILEEPCRQQLQTWFESRRRERHHA